MKGLFDARMNPEDDLSCLSFDFKFCFDDIFNLTIVTCLNIREGKEIMLSRLFIEINAQHLWT